MKITTTKPPLLQVSFLFNGSSFLGKQTVDYFTLQQFENNVQNETETGSVKEATPFPSGVQWWMKKG